MSVGPDGVARLPGDGAGALAAGGLISVARARKLAEGLIAELLPACARIEIAGSLRRMLPLEDGGRVGDIELVAVPRELARDLFGAEDLEARHSIDQRVDELLAEGLLAPRLTDAGVARRGRRYQALETTGSKAAIDLFVVLPPAQWGAIFTIRTGPWTFSRTLVTACKRRGLDCVDGRLVDASGRTRETPTEHDFFRECGIAWVPPEARR